METLAAPLLQRIPSFDRFGLSSFAQCVHTSFRIVQSGRPTVQLALTEVRATSEAGRSNSVQGMSSEHQFSLLFRGSHDVPLTQDTYAFEHAALGRFSMFIVPVGLRDGKACYYEAIFNRATGPVV